MKDHQLGWPPARAALAAQPEQGPMPLDAEEELDILTARLEAALAAQPTPAYVPLTIADINALPEAQGWWPMGMNDRIMRLIRAVERLIVERMAQRGQG